MRKLLFTAVSALTVSIATMLLAAQTAMSTMSATPTMSAEQSTSYEGWTVAQRASFDGWPADYQAYYWTLNPTQSRGWWKLNDVQRKQVMDMTPAQRASMWFAVEAQLDRQAAMAAQVQANPVGSDQPASATAPDPASADASVAPAMPADAGYQAGPYKGALTAAPAEAMNKVYPWCTKTLRDSCRNRGGK